ncbi:hypothetical protein RvY_16042 [Ramazzottius varieornatus]|uniref:Uncharacterized protein n=1 Tax=Ramazzottius varieornatus TaxID=947166 RepID=A0A1D1W4V9_RAMVA|nr:hypothetical protein RvY_16042 [Ramazzottius varieornatus]
MEPAKPLDTEEIAPWSRVRLLITPGVNPPPAVVTHVPLSIERGNVLDIISVARDIISQFLELAVL